VKKWKFYAVSLFFSDSSKDTEKAGRMTIPGGRGSGESKGGGQMLTVVGYLLLALLGAIVLIFGAFPIFSFWVWPWIKIWLDRKR
jgi:hypothetical protein